MSSHGRTGGAGSSASPTLRKWGILVLLAVVCSGTYIFLYYRVTIVTSVSFIRTSATSHPNNSDLHPFYSNPGTKPEGPVGTKPEGPVDTKPEGPVDTKPEGPVGTKPEGPVGTTVRNSWWNMSDFTSAKALKASIDNGTALPLLTLFTTWSDRPDLQLVRNLTFRNWKQLAPYATPVLFTNSSSSAEEARSHGWRTLPVSRTAVGVPILKYLYLDAMKHFNSTLYSFANGDILFTQSLVDSLLTVLTDPSLPLDDHPLLVVGQRTNVANVTDQEALTFANLTRMAKARGKRFITMAEDFFITNRRFPWSVIPEVVIGRVGYDNWVVLYAIQNQYVVVDASQTVLAVHQTTKAGNKEGHSHLNASYNTRMLTNLYKRIRYWSGCVDCAPWRTTQAKNDRLEVQKRAKKPKHC